MMGGEIASALKVFGPEDLRLVEVPLGALGADDVRVRLGAGGICGSDLHYFKHGRNGNFQVTEPLTLGHEIAGVVVAVGSAVKTVAPGDKVAINPARWCGQCPECLRGDINYCPNGYFMGSASKTPHMHGGLATLFDVRATQCVVLDADIPLERAAFAEPVSVCLHAVNRAGNIEGADIAVTGCGPIGLLTGMVAMAKGARQVTMLDIVDQPLQLARQLGLNTHLLSGPLDGKVLNRFDVVFEASGAPPALANAFDIVRRSGTIVQIGNFAHPELKLPSNQVMSKQITWTGTFRFGDVFAEAVELIATGQIDVAALITASFDLAGAQEAFAIAADKTKAMKVLITL